MQESCTTPWWKTWKKTSGRDRLTSTARWACISLIKLRTSIRFSVFNTSHGKSNNNQISSIGLPKPTSSLARGFRSISLPINRFMGSQGFMGSVVDRKLLAREDVKPKVPMEVLILLRLSLYLFFIIWLVCTKKWSVRIENKIVPWGYIYRYMQTLYMIPTIKIGLILKSFF